MSNVPLIFQPLVKYADFQGRSRRSEFWLWALLRYIVNSVLGIIVASVMMGNMSVLFTNPNPDPQVFMQHYFGSMMTIVPIMSVVRLAFLLPDLAVGVRRLHDIGRSGWWLVMPHVVAIVSVIIALIIFGTQIYTAVDHAQAQEQVVSDQEELRIALTMFGSLFLCVGLPVLIAEIVMLVFYVTEGRRGPNRFGPDPKGEALNDTP
ncbi:MAG: DUF805 domain-containing protein [Asticcacaulis sp.]